MPFTLPALPFAEDALEPHISARTFQYHHGKHHKAYVDTLNKLIEGGKFADKSLEEIIRATADATDGTEKKIFNNAAQVWNHTFFWHCLSPKGGEPTGEIAERIKKDFGSYDDFCAKFKDTAVGQFGSGWAWLVEDGGKLAIVSTPNAVTPVAKKQKPLLTCDVWEHAYYLDYQNERPRFVETFLRKLANWDFAATALKADGAITQDQMSGSGVEGEGSYTATRAYNDGIAKSLASGKTEAEAKAAEKALDGKEGAELKKAEAAGKSHARG